MSTDRRPTHWLPIAIPAVLTTLALAFVVYFVTRLPNSTVGQRAALRMSVQSLIMFAGITLAGWLWLRTHRARTRPSAAWAATIAALAVLAL